MTQPLAPSQATTTAIGESAVSGAQVGPVEQSIAQKIAMGLLPTPDSTEGWQDLVDQFSTPDAPVSTGTPSAQKLADPLSSVLGSNPMAPKAAPASQPSGKSQAADPSQTSFMQQMAPYAKQAAQATGLDPALILAQWGNETGWGTSQAWTQDFNPAGIGVTGSGVQSQNFGSVEGGVQAYINFLNQNPRYQAVKSAQGAQAQAVALGESGWAAGQYNNGSGPGSDLLQELPITQGAVGGATAAPANNAVNIGGNQSSAVSVAQSVLGTPYVWGGGGSGGESHGQSGDPADPNAPSQTGFDCSGLTQYAYAKAGIQLPRTAQAQYNATTPVPNGQALQPGDLVFFGASTQQISHVGIYIGNGQMIDAPHTGADVRVESYQWSDFVGATRPGDAGGASSLPTSAAPGSGTVTAGESLSSYYMALSQMQSAMNARGPR